MTDTARFDWTEDVEALSLTLVRGLDDVNIVTKLGLKQMGDEPLTLQDAWGEHFGSANVGEEGEFEDGGIVQIDHLDGWTVIIEDNGYFGSLEENLGPLSAGGQAVNVFWNVNMSTSFGDALAGKV